MKNFIFFLCVLKSGMVCAMEERDKSAFHLFPIPMVEMELTDRPSYPAGHADLSGAAGMILKDFFMLKAQTDDEKDSGDDLELLEDLSGYTCWSGDEGYDSDNVVTFCPLSLRENLFDSPLSLDTPLGSIYALCKAAREQGIVCEAIELLLKAGS